MEKSKTLKKESAAYEEAVRRYGGRDNVTAIDIGYKNKDGQELDALVVRIHVKEKISESALEAAQIFPNSINDVPIDIIEANYEPHGVESGTKDSAMEDIFIRKTRFKTLKPGISVAHKNCSSGTLGAFVEDKQSGKRAILSNWHVLAGSSSARPGDDIIQPGPFDGGHQKRDTVAKLERMILDQDGDAAIAILNGERGIDPHIYDTNDFLRGIRDPQIGEVLIKSGRTTGITRAKVDGYGTYFISYSSGRKGITGFKLVSEKPGNPDNEEISSGGDSGSIWYDPDSKEAVGLHFAGETSPNPSREHALACFTSRVFPKLNIDLIKNKEIVEKKSSSKLSKIFENLLGWEFSVGAESAGKDVDMEEMLKRLIEKYPALAALEEGEKVEREKSQPDLEPFISSGINFALNAAIEMMKKSSAKKSSLQPEELASLGVSAAAFIIGVITGMKVTGKQ